MAGKGDVTCPHLAARYVCNDMSPLPATRYEYTQPLREQGIYAYTPVNALSFCFGRLGGFSAGCRTNPKIFLSTLTYLGWMESIL